MNSPALTTEPNPMLSEAILADLCKASADRLRLRVIRLLSQDAMDVSELCEVLDVRQPALSHHLKLMTAAGLLSTQRDGNHIFYRRNERNENNSLGLLQRALFSAADALPLDVDTHQRREDLQRKREARSIDFFNSHADRFREQQDLIAAPERYAAAVEAVLNEIAPSPAAQRRTAIEIGPGDGWLLPRLSALFNEVTAVDNAPTMLDAARRTASKAKLDNVRFLLGDTGHGELRDAQADLVVMNMVLHHTPDPRRTLCEAASSLNPDGSLLITELCEHSQGWARENCGDLWLGFSTEQIEEWAQDADLKEVSGSYLGQRNGFKLQVRRFASASTSMKR